MSKRPWIMMQKWRHVFFSHWPVSVEQLEAHIPAPLQLDAYERQAWISVIHFIVDGMYARGLQRWSLAAPFAEINVRTYVTHRGKPGVYFFSLDAPHWSTYTLARMWYKIPFFRADVQLHMKSSAYLWSSTRIDSRSDVAVFKGAYKPQSRTASRPLVHWLTDRYTMYSADNQKQLYSREVRPPPWQLQHAEAEIEMNSLLAPFSVENGDELQPCCIQYSPGVDAFFTNRTRL